MSWLVAHLRWVSGFSRNHFHIHCLPILEALPPHTHRGIDAHKQEERSSKQGIDNLFIPNVCCNPVLPPS